LDQIRDCIESSILTYREYDDETIPKSHRFYHALTRGFILNELFRRVEPNGRSMNEYFVQEISPILSKDDECFKLYLKGKPKNDKSDVVYVENINKLWLMYHFVVPFLTNITSHLPKRNYFNKYIEDVGYSNFGRFKKLIQLNQEGDDSPNYAPEWNNVATECKVTSKKYENEQDIEMEWMSATGIMNAHSMSKLMSFCLNTLNENTLKELLKDPKAAYDAAVFSTTEFTKGGFCRSMLYGIEWFLWGGLGGSYYGFAPKYKCVLSFTVTGYNRADLGFTLDPKQQRIPRGPRGLVIFYYTCKYLKSL